MKVVANMEQNMDRSGMNEGQAEKERTSFEDILEKWVYESIRKDEKNDHPFDSAA